MGGRRNFRAQRCPACGLHIPLCLCASMPRLRLETHVVLVQNNHERNKPTNTGRLASLMLDASERLFYGVRGEPFDPSPLLDPGTDYWLIFHRPERSRILTRDRVVARPGRRRALVFLDGTWAQCSRMSRRIAALESMPMLALPPGPPSPWRVRGETHPERMSTLEAVIRALEIVEGPGPARRMREWFYAVTARTMYMKSMLPSPELPSEWAALLGDGN